jgi:hypothetical protein
VELLYISGKSTTLVDVPDPAIRQHKNARTGHIPNELIHSERMVEHGPTTSNTPNDDFLPLIYLVRSSCFLEQKQPTPVLWQRKQVWA